MKTLGKLLLLSGSLVMAACTSPEATRSRGELQGGDVGNRPDDVIMHEGSDPFWETPVTVPTDHPSLEPARQAKKLSQP